MKRDFIKEFKRLYDSMKVIIDSTDYENDYQKRRDLKEIIREVEILRVELLCCSPMDIFDAPLFRLSTSLSGDLENRVNQIIYEYNNCKSIINRDLTDKNRRGNLKSISFWNELKEEGLILRNIRSSEKSELRNLFSSKNLKQLSSELKEFYEYIKVREEDGVPLDKFFITSGDYLNKLLIVLYSMYSYLEAPDNEFNLMIGDIIELFNKTLSKSDIPKYSSRDLVRMATNNCYLSIHFLCRSGVDSGAISKISKFIENLTEIYNDTEFWRNQERW